jgi:hypothetical protein
MAAGIEPRYADAMFCPSPRAPQLSLGVALALSACSDSSGDETRSAGAGGLAGTVSCTSDPRLDTYTDDLDKPGELGVLSFRFSELEPAPPAKGNNTFHVHVSDANGSTLEGPLGVELLMPDHEHESTVEPVVSFDAASGMYRVAPLYLFMAGVWRIEFEAYSGSAGSGLPLDRVALHFCVQG